MIRIIQAQAFLTAPGILLAFVPAPWLRMIQLANDDGNVATAYNSVDQGVIGVDYRSVLRALGLLVASATLVSSICR